MIPSGSWLHITVGFIFGVMSTVFALITSKVLKQSNIVRKLLGLLVLFTLSGALLSFIYASALSGGLLIEWQPLGYPSDPAVKVVDIGYVQTQSGNIYHFSCLNCSGGNWEQVGNVTKNEQEHFIP